MLYIAFMHNRDNLNLEGVDLVAKSRKWWNEGARPKGLKPLGIYGALGTDAKDVLIFEAASHDDIRAMVEFWRNEVELEIHPAVDLADQFRRQGMNIP